MKTLASRAAAGITALFVAAAAITPVLAQEPGPAGAPVAPVTTADEAPGTQGTPAALRDSKYRELLEALGALRGEQAPVAIPETNQQVPLPAIFEKAVRGCTLDGHIYRLTYNLTYDPTDLSGPGASTLLSRTVKPDAAALLGVTGTDGYLDALKTLIGTVDDSMRVRAGRLIDETDSANFEGEVYKSRLSRIEQEIAADILKRYGVDITILSGTPRQQGDAKCAPAIDQADASPLPGLTR